MTIEEKIRELMNLRGFYSEEMLQDIYRELIGGYKRL